MLENIELKLLAGYSIETDVGNMYQPKIKDIISIGEKEYNQYIGLLLYDTDLLEIPKNELKKLGLNKVTTFDFLLFQSMINKNFRKIVREGLSFFFKEKTYILDNYGLFCVGNFHNHKFINRDNYEYIRKVLIKINYLKDMEEEEELQFGNELARQWYLKIKKAEQNKPNPKPQVNLHSIISAIIWRTQKSIDEILNMTIYQLYDGYHRLFLIDDCLGIKEGIYHGTIDGKEIKPNDLNWAKIIKFEEN